MDDEVAVAATTRVAQVFDLHTLKAFAPDKRVRKMLFKTEQLWSEIACYEPGQSTVMHHHPREEEAIYVLEGTRHHEHRRRRGHRAGRRHRELPGERAARRPESGCRAVRHHVPQGEPQGAEGRRRRGGSVGRRRWATWSGATRRCRPTR